MPLPPTPESVALSRSRLTTPGAVVAALFSALDAEERRGAPPTESAAFGLLARRLLEVLPKTDPVLLEAACRARQDRQERAPLIVALFSEDLGYDDARKHAFHHEAIRLLRQLGGALGLSRSDYDVRWNPGGVAVSGEAMLFTDRLFLQVSQTGCPLGDVLFRSTARRGDSGRGANHWARVEMLADPVRLAEHVARTLSLPSPAAAAGRLL